MHFNADVQVDPRGPSTQGDGSFDVVTRHHERNRAPHAPDPERLRALHHGHGTTDVDTGGNDTGTPDEDSDSQDEMPS